MNHKRRKRKKYGVKGHCTMCAMATRAGGLRNRRLPTPAEMRAPAVEVPEVYGCDVGHYHCEGWAPGGVCPHHPDDEHCTCHRHGGLDSCDVHGASIFDCGWDYVADTAEPLRVPFLEALR